METIIGTLIGAVIAALAMILNSVYSAKIAREKDDQNFKRKNFDRYLTELEALYEEALHLSDKLIRGKGRALAEELEKFYRVEVQLSLKSTAEIHTLFTTLKNEIATMAHKLPTLPEEFIPTFESDEQRKQRLQRRREADAVRDEEARPLLGHLYKLHNDLADKMKTHLAEKKRRSRLNEHLHKRKHMLQVESRTATLWEWEWGQRLLSTL